MKYLFLVFFIFIFSCNLDKKRVTKSIDINISETKHFNIVDSIYDEILIKKVKKHNSTKISFKIQNFTLSPQDNNLNKISLIKNEYQLTSGIKCFMFVTGLKEKDTLGYIIERSKGAYYFINPLFKNFRNGEEIKGIKVFYENQFINFNNSKDSILNSLSIFNKNSSKYQFFLNCTWNLKNDTIIQNRKYRTYIRDIDEYNLGVNMASRNTDMLIPYSFKIDEYLNFYYFSFFYKNIMCVYRINPQATN